jgi:hypothetical protein
MDYERYNDYDLEALAKASDRNAMRELDTRGLNTLVLNSIRRAHPQARSGPSWTCRHCRHVNRGTDSSAFYESCGTPRG